LDGDRPRTAIVAGVVVAAAVACLVLYEAYVPGRVDEVVGSVVTREVLVDDSATPPRHYVHVRLGDGNTVRARTERFVNLMPEDQIVLVRIETPLLGWHRYRYKQHVHPDRRPAAPAERLTQ
jgi:hypothetical protein